MATLLQMLIYIAAVLGVLDLAVAPLLGGEIGDVDHTDEDGPF